MAGLRATARKAARAAFVAAGDVLVDAVVKLGATVGDYDPATDTAPTTWAMEATIKVLPFDDAEEKNDVAPEDRLKVFVTLGESLVDGSGAEIRGEQEGEIVVDGVKWNVVKTETDPTATVWLFYCRH